MAWLRRVSTLAMVAALLMLTGAARGETTPVLVELSVGSDVVDEASLRAAIGRELECPVVVNRAVNHAGEVRVKSLPSGQVSVTFVPADDRAALKRVLRLPQTPEHRVQLIAWLVGNLARNEAAEWLAKHQREKQAELAKQQSLTVRLERRQRAESRRKNRCSE